MGDTYGRPGELWLGTLAYDMKNLRSRALKAASEQASPADWFLGDDFHHNGAFRLSYGFEHVAQMETGKTNQPFQFEQYDTYDWYLALGPLREVNARFFHGEKPTWNNFVAHPNYDDFWKRSAAQRIVVAPKVPNLNVGGWFDQEDFAGPWRIFAASETPESRQFNYVVEGPWNHGGWFSGSGRRLKNLDFTSNTGEYFRQKIQARWFHHWLKDAPNTRLEMPRIQLFETGSNQWRAYDEWPPRDAQPVGDTYGSPGELWLGTLAYDMKNLRSRALKASASSGVHQSRKAAVASNIRQNSSESIISFLVGQPSNPKP